MPRKWYTAQVIDIKQESSQTRRYFLKIMNESERFSFRAGQFITFDLPTGEKRLDRWRSYSIANQPNNDQLIELCVVFLEGGKASKYFKNDVNIGTELRFKGPEGNFCLPKQAKEDLVMICTGTGVAPFKSMIDHHFNQEGPHSKIHLIFGTRDASGILYQNHFENLAASNDKFKYSVALSRDTYNGYTGYVHGLYKEAYSKNTKNTLFYLCGWSNMVDEAKHILMNELEVPPTQIILELYG